MEWVSVWRSKARSEQLRQLWRTWRIPLSLAALIGGTLFARGSSQAVVSSHAEVALNRSLPVVLDVPWRLLNRLNGVALDGLEAGRGARNLGELAPDITDRRGHGTGLLEGSALGRRAAAIVLLSLALVMTMGIGLQWQKGQALPLEPRPSWCCYLCWCWWVDALRLQPKWVRWASAVLLFGLIGTPSWKQLSHTSTLQDWASEQVSTQARSGDWVIAPEPLSWRMDLPSDVRLHPCLSPRMPDAQRIWWVRLQDGSRPLSMEPCPDSPEGDVDLSAYSLVHVEARGPPNMNETQHPFCLLWSFLATMGQQEANDEVVRNLNISGGWWSGLDYGQLRISLETEDASVLFAELEPSLNSRS